MGPGAIPPSDSFGFNLKDKYLGIHHDVRGLLANASFSMGSFVCVDKEVEVSNVCECPLTLCDATLRFCVFAETGDGLSNARWLLNQGQLVRCKPS